MSNWQKDFRKGRGGKGNKTVDTRHVNQDLSRYAPLFFSLWCPVLRFMRIRKNKEKCNRGPDRESKLYSNCRKARGRAKRQAKKVTEADRQEKQDVLVKPPKMTFIRHRSKRPTMDSVRGQKQEEGMYREQLRKRTQIP